MQKRLLFVAFLLLAICNKIVADDQLTVSNVSMYPGDSKEVSIELTNTESYVGFQFDLYLPNGITIESYSRSSRIPDGTTLEMAQQTDGGYRFIAAGLGGNTITGNEGAVMTITLKSADAIALNDYTAYLRQVKVSKADGSGITVAELPFTVTIAERPKVASVTFAPNGYRVTLNTTTEGADIYYTLSNSNEGEQTCTSGTELTLGGDCTIMAYAMKDGYNTSDTTTYTFFAADVTVATPTFNQTDNVVTIATTTENTTIYYTLDGTEPTTLSNVYAEPGITLTGNVIVKAFATRTNWFSSAVATYDVTSFKVAPVAFAQNGNQITLSTTTEGATIYYILSTDSVYSEYTAPLTMTGDCTITAYATKVGYTQSETTSFEFHAGGVTCSNPVLARTEGTNVVTASTTTEGATIYCTTDGSEPTQASSVFPEGGMPVYRNQTIKAIAMRDTYYPSQVTTFEVDWFQCETPTFTWNGDELTITSTSRAEDGRGATILYTMVESSAAGTVVPDTMIYNGPITVTRDVIITAIARVDGYKDSQEARLVYSYNAWQTLAEAIALAQSVSAQAARNAHVTSEQRDYLDAVTAQAQTLYAERTADVDAINAMNAQLRTAIADVEDLLSIKDAYAVLSVANAQYGYRQLTFYYDNQKGERGGMNIGPFNSYSDRPYDWKNNDVTVHYVVFDPSFADCTTITSTANWFYNFSALETVTGLEYLNTSNVTDMSYMFSNCAALKTLDVSTFDTRKVTNMLQMFYYCRSLRTLDVSNFNTGNVTNMAWMFSNCSGLTSLDVSSFNTEKVTNMNSMFEYCNRLTTLDLANFNTENVTDMNAMFRICTNLVSVNVSSFNTENVTDMGGMFYNCPALTNLDLSSFNTEKVTNMNGMFDRSKLYVIYVGDKWTNAQVTEGDGMFSNCTNLVGGAWTAYDADHTDHTYAHIDGGVENPGYLTSIADTAAAAAVTFSRSMYELTLNCETPNVKIYYSIMLAGGVAVEDGRDQLYTQPITLWADCEVIAHAVRANGVSSAVSTYTFNMSDINTVETPTFSWNGDELTISCATEGASIYYTIFEGQESDETYVPEEKLYTGPITVTFNTVITAVARMQGMNDSEVATLNYPYFSWNHLLQSIEYAKAVMHRVVDEGKYEQVAELYDALDVELAKAQVLYNNRNRSEDAASIDSLANQLGAAARTIEDILDTPTEKLDTPVISWNGDEMYWLVYQQGSGVMTWLSDFDSNNDGVVDDKDFFNIHTTLTIKRDVTIRAYSYMEGKLNSDTITIDYPYTAWMSLLEALNYSNYVVSLCQGSSKVSQDDVMALRTKIEDATYLYSLRQEKRAVIENIAQELRMRAAQLEAQVTDVDFTYDTTTGSLTVSGGTTMDEALEAAGGRNTVAGHVTSIIWDKDTPLTDDMLEGFTNPNMLVYVKDASLAPSTVTNVIVDGVADFILLVDTDSLDNDFYCPQEFRTRTISYTRLFGQSTEIGVCRGWETIALPFEPLTISHEKNGLLRPFASAANDGKPFWLRQMSATGLVDAERIEANVPYIISMPNNPNYADEFNQAGRVTFSATDVVIPATDLGEVEGATVSLIPTFQRVAKAPEVYAINRYEAYGNNLEGSVFVSELRDVRPFEAYTRHHDQSPAPMFYPLSEWLEDGANGIDEIVLAMSRMAGQSETWYTLDGRKLNGQPKTKGVYIVKGKKVVVR